MDRLGTIASFPTLYTSKIARRVLQLRAAAHTHGKIKQGSIGR